MIGLLAVPLLVMLVDRCYQFMWIGNYDLEVVFVVTDAGTGLPVPEANVEIQDFGGDYQGGNHDSRIEYVLSTDPQGTVTRMCPRNTCIGTDSLLGLSSTFDACLPSWRVRATAAGYEPGEWVKIGGIGQNHQARRQSRTAKLTINLPLRKSP